MDLIYIPLLLASLFLFVIAYLERNKEQKGLSNPILLGVIGLLYILLMSLDYHFMAVLIGVAGLVILIITILQRTTLKRK